MNIINKYIKQFTDKIENKVDDLAGLVINDVTGPSSINKFRSKMESKGIAKPNNFVVSFELPSFLQNKLNFLSIIGLPTFSETLGIACYKAVIPHSAITKAPVKYINNVTRAIPVGYKWDSITFSFIENQQYQMYKLFSKWISSINNPITNTGMFYNDTISSVKINFFNKKNNVLSYIALEEAQPTSVQITDFDWNKMNQYVSVDVTFDYMYQYNEDFNISEVLNAVTDFGSSDLVQTISQTYNWGTHISSSLENFFNKKL